MRPVPSGNLDQRVRIQHKTVVRDDIGGHTETWADLATVWAEVRPMTGKQIVNAKAIGSEANMLVTIRNRSGLSADMRILLADGSVAMIEWLQVYMSREPFLEIHCRILNG